MARNAVPLAWTPKKREGFLYSSDGRFSRTERFQASPRLEKQDTTDENGSASILLNPALELTAQPRTYVVEATVTGADDQTVTASKSVSALPAFVLGMKVPRYIERAKEITPEIIVVGPDDTLLAGKEVTVRLLRREWHSALKASDFSDGVARYVTDVVDEKVSERTVKSAAAPVKVTFPVTRAGVYVVELEAHDKLDRAQVVRVDLYAGGDQRVAWPKPVTRVFTVTPDKAKYDPGMTASIVLQSPFQKARAVAVVETPDGNKYHWIDVEGGTAVFNIAIQSNYAPRLPVHFILMRGRLPGTGPAPGSGMDAGKPETMAATAWLDVNPLAHQAKVELEYPPVARPGEKLGLPSRSKILPANLSPERSRSGSSTRPFCPWARNSVSIPCLILSGRSIPSSRSTIRETWPSAACLCGEPRRRRGQRRGVTARKGHGAEEFQDRAVL